MLFNNIKIGDRIEITMVRSASGRSYVSQVEEIIGEDELLIHMPISYGQLVKLPEKEQYSMLFFTEKGMISFDGSIFGFTKEASFNFMKVRIADEGERIQRREFFRYTCLIPLKFCVIEEGYTGGNEKLYDGIIKDIGGGGVRYVTNESVEENSKMKCIVMLGDDCLILIGNMLHKQYFPKSNYKYQYRIEFTGILHSEQEKIIQFIFNEQRKELQKIKN